MTVDRAEVVVVGGGVVGTAVAYTLAKAGLEVVVLEQTGIASGATGHGHGVISLIGNDFRPGAHAALGLASARMYAAHVEAVHEDSGMDPLYHELPGLSVALLDEEEAIFRESLTRLERMVDARWLDGDDCRRLEPRLSPDVRGGVLYRHAQVDASALAVAQAHALARLGGRVVAEQAIGLACRRDRVTGVLVANGTIDAGAVVLAMGASLADAEPWCGLRLPVRPLHGEVLHVRLAGEPLEHFIITARHGPILPRRDGILMVGSIGGVTMSGTDVERTHSFDPREARDARDEGRPRSENRELMIAMASRVLPVLERSEVVAHLAGVRPLSADRMPLIGPVPGLAGAFVAGGHGTKGIHLAPVTGAAIAHLLRGGDDTFPVTLEPFAPGRFA